MRAAFLESSARRLASCGGSAPPSTGIHAPSPHASMNRSTTARTVTCDSCGGPKFQASPPRRSAPTTAGSPRQQRRASARYPESDSRTCCQGRTASGLRTDDGLPAAQCASAVRDDALLGPVTAADHVARARGGDSDVAGGTEEAPREGSRDELRAGLTRAVGIESAQGIALRAGLAGLLILVALVAGDDDDRDAVPLDV